MGARDRVQSEKQNQVKKTTIQEFIYLLKFCFHPKKTDEAMEKRLRSPQFDWEPVLLLARTHNLLALIFELASEISDTFVTSEVYQRYAPSVIGSIAGQMRRTELLFDIYGKLQEQGVFPLILKGIICRKLYGRYADCRPSADEDLLITPKEFEQTKVILLDNFYEIEDKKECEQILDEIQEVTFCHPGGLSIELHLNPIGQESMIKRTFNDYFKDVTKHYLECDIQGHRIRTMTYTDHYLFLFFHTLKHFCEGGVGIRQVLDLLLFREKYAAEMDWEYIGKALQETGGYPFYCDCMEIGKRYLGFEVPNGKYYRPKELLEDILYSGAFGNDTKEKLLASRMTSMAVISGADSSLLRRIMIFLFPPKESFMMFRPELMTKPYLLPLEWIRRWIRFIKKYLLRNPQKEMVIKSSLHRGKRRIRLLQKYGILR